ncbi:hypothetical protein BH11PLA1_BH11PLA1_20550 [soil metagenome]
MKGVSPRGRVQKVPGSVLESNNRFVRFWQLVVVRALLAGGGGERTMRDAEGRLVRIRRGVAPLQFLWVEREIREDYLKVLRLSGFDPYSAWRRIFAASVVAGFFVNVGWQIYFFASISTTIPGRGWFPVVTVVPTFMMGLAAAVHVMLLIKRWPLGSPRGTAEKVAEMWLKVGRCPVCWYSFGRASNDLWKPRQICAECGCSWHLEAPSCNATLMPPANDAATLAP